MLTSSLLCITARTSPNRLAIATSHLDRGCLATSHLDPPRVHQKSRFELLSSCHMFLCLVCKCVFEDGKWKRPHKQRYNWFCLGNTAVDSFIEG